MEKSQKKKVLIMLIVEIGTIFRNTASTYQRISSEYNQFATDDEKHLAKKICAWIREIIDDSVISSNCIHQDKINDQLLSTLRDRINEVERRLPIVKNLDASVLTMLKKLYQGMNILMKEDREIVKEKEAKDE